MKISNITLYHIQIPFKQAIQTSYGQLTHKECVVLTLQSDQGLVGLGELTALPHPDYVQEFLAGELLVLKRYLLPLLANQGLTPQSFMQKAAKIRGHQMAKAAIEMALWDLYAKLQEKSLSYFLPPTLSTAQVGISFGIQNSPQALLAKVDQAVLQGYQRVKVKIAPDKDYDYSSDAETCKQELDSLTIGPLDSVSFCKELAKRDIKLKLKLKSYYYYN